MVWKVLGWFSSGMSQLLCRWRDSETTGPTLLHCGGENSLPVVHVDFVSQQPFLVTQTGSAFCLQ